MKTLQIKTSSNQYPIHIETGSFEKTVHYLNQWHQAETFFIITDDAVDAFYGEAILGLFADAGISCIKIVLPRGENSKAFAMYESLSEAILERGITKKDALVAFGGGVVGDLTGFLAATLLRGVPFFQIPTTLLSQIDSSIGGKVAINSKSGKNLIGAIYPPKGVLIDPLLLETLPKRHFSDGMAEAIKYAMIKDFNLYAWLMEKKYPMGSDDLEALIANCCQIKKAVVEADEFENKERMVLNFGHTIGHVIERYFDIGTYTHGEAVALGMMKVTAHSEAEGLTQSGTTEKIKTLLMRYDLPTDFPKMEKEKALKLLFKDKKNTSDQVRWVILTDIGQAKLYLLDKEAASKWIE